MMLRRLAADVAKRAVQQYSASTSGVQHVRAAFELHGLHQSSLAYATDLRVRLIGPAAPQTCFTVSGSDGASLRDIQRE